MFPYLSVGAQGVKRIVWSCFGGAEQGFGVLDGIELFFTEEVVRWQKAREWCSSGR